MSFSKKEFLEYTGGVPQFGGAEEMQYSEGKQRGMRVYRVRTGGGLEFDLLPDRALDISRLSFRGINMNWLSKTGYSSPAFVSPVVGEFDRYFSGGMLMTCGFKNTGADYVGEDGRFRDGHGRIGMTPTEESWKRISWVKDRAVVEAGARTRDSLLGAHNLVMERHLTAPIGESRIVIEDTLRNEEPSETDYLILYHVNFGYPFMAPGLSFKMPEAISPMLPRTPYAEKGMKEWDLITEPIQNEEEQCYFHHLRPDADGMCKVIMENQALGIGVELSYLAENLPVLTIWKSLRTGEYALGVEPGNSYLRGIDEERKEGTIGYIEAYGTRKFRLELRFFDL